MKKRVAGLIIALGFPGSGLLVCCLVDSGVLAIGDGGGEDMGVITDLI